MNNFYNKFLINVNYLVILIINMKKIINYLGFALLTALLLVGCKKENQSEEEIDDDSDYGSLDGV